jgi:Arc/MetJ family transcription regulator
MHIDATMPAMRITVDIEDDTLAELLKLTGEKKKSSAVSKVVVDYLNRRKAKEFGRLLREGHFDFDFTNEDVERGDS